MKLRCPEIALLALAAATLSFSPGRCAAQSSAECLAASEASLRFETDHRLRAERAQLAVCAAATCPAEIRRECVRRVDEVNLAIPTIIFVPRDPSGDDLATVRVTMDGEPLAERLEGIALPIDPGEHVFRFEAADRQIVVKSLVVREAEKNRHEAIAFGPMLHADARRAARFDTREGSSGRWATRIAAMALGGVALAAIGVGTAWGLTAASRRDAAAKECPAACATSRGVDLWASAKSAGNVSTVAFVAAGALTVGAVMVWWIGEARAPRRPAVQLGLGPATLKVSGTW